MIALEHERPLVGVVSDWELLQEFLGTRSEAVFSRLVNRHLGFVYRVCLRETGDQQSAEDAALETLLLLSQKAHTIRQGVQLTTWLFSTARLTARNAVRQ